MKLTKLQIRNFKAIVDVTMETQKSLNVIVGPNAVGKTTILESIRLVKSLLSPRYMQESQQVLQSLGALSANFPILGAAGFDYSAIANDVTKDVEIGADFQLTANEVADLKVRVDEVTMAMLQSRMARNDDLAQLQFTQFLSTDDGKTQFQQVRDEATLLLENLQAGMIIPLRLSVVAGTNQFRGQNLFNQQLISMLDRALPPQLTKMSYFPADRAFPQGEVVIQLGSNDAQAQVQAHLGQPASKYGRLKITIAQGILLERLEKASIEQEFAKIFDALLPGKKFEHLVVNPVGVVKVMVRDKATDKIFDIDNMSSGEKGLICVFLLAVTTLSEGAILLLDEPELHLNPAVTRNIMEFVATSCADRLQAQVFICTHSGEILGDAYGMEQCGLYHLRSGHDLSPVYRQDTAEVAQILDRLGVSTADVLFSKGNIFVEGPHDDELLSEGFGHIVGPYKITARGGREEVEKAIRDLSTSTEELGRVKLFIFDRDRSISGSSSKPGVIVKQWGRYCFENYLLDDKPLFDVTNEFAVKKPESRGQFLNDLKADALAQVEDVAIRRAYARLEPDNPGLRPNELRGKSVAEVATVLASRLATIRGQLASFEEATWASDFESEVSADAARLATEWQNSWRTEADGKALIDRIYERYTPRLDKLTFKKRVIRAMRIEQSETWRAVAGILGDALAQSPS